MTFMRTLCVFVLVTGFSYVAWLTWYIETRDPKGSPGTVMKFPFVFLWRLCIKIVFRVKNLFTEETK